MAEKITELQGIEQRKKFVTAFNNTMVRIWKEQILLLDVYDTGYLHRSLPLTLQMETDKDATEAKLVQVFVGYGLWQDYGVGGEVPRGNPGDIGHAKVRKRRRWFSKKFYASTMKLKEVFADSLGREFCGIVADALSDKKMREQMRSR